MHLLGIRSLKIIVSGLKELTKGMFLTFLRSLPPDLSAAGPHEALCSRSDRRRGVSGPHLDWTSAGRH